MKRFIILATSLLMVLTGCDVIPTAEKNESAEAPGISVIQSDLVFSNAGGTGTIIVEASGHVSAYCPQGWCQVNVINDRTISVTVDKSNLYDSRYANVNLSSDGAQTMLTVHQFGIRLYGFDPETTLDFGKNGGSISFPYEADCPLTAESDCDWIIATWNEDGLTIQVGEYEGLRVGSVNWDIQGAAHGYIKVTQDGAWRTLGKCAYTDAFMSAVFDVEDETYPVEIQESVAEVGMYRLINPYGRPYPYNEPGDYDALNSYYMYVNAVDRDNVRIIPFNSGCDWSYGNFVMSSTLSGKYENNIITFPKNGLAITLPKYSEEPFPANENGTFKIDLNGLY